MNQSALSLILEHGSIWSVDARYADRMWDALDRMDLHVHLTEWEDAKVSRSVDSVQPNKDEKPYDVVGGNALIPVAGVMTKKGSSMGQSASTVMLRRMVRQAASDPDVKRMVMMIDSPGGSVSGLSDLVGEVASAKKSKPIVSYVEDMCCSAAYWLASQTDAIYSNSAMADIGSLGVRMVVTDSSRAAENAGFKVIPIDTGAFKSAGAPGTKITDEQIAEWQKSVDETGGEFKSAIATGRNMDMSKVSDLFDGRVWSAREAQKLGLIDGIARLDDVLAMKIADDDEDDVTHGAVSADITRLSEGFEDRSPSFTAGQPVQSGKENRMTLKERFMFWFSGLSDDAFESMGDGDQGASQPATTVVAEIKDGKATVDFTQTDAYKAMSEQIATLSATVNAQQSMIQSATEDLAKARAKADQEAATARVERAVEGGFIMPAQKANFIGLADKSTDAFNAAMDVIEQGSPLPAFLRNRVVNAEDLVEEAQGDGSELIAKAKARMSKDNISFHEALKLVSSENPALAERYRSDQERLARANAAGL